MRYLLCLSFLVCICPTGSAARSAAPDPAPLTSSALKEKLAAGKSKARIVNLWATWCAPCRAEMPELLELRKKYASKGVELILISGDAVEDMKEARGFLSEIGVDFETFHLKEAPDQFMKPFLPNWAAVLPTTLLFDRSGQRIAVWTNKVKIAEVETKLKSVLEKSKR